MSEQEKVYHTLKGIEECLKNIGAGKLVTVNEWARLFLFLCHKCQIDLECPPMLPRSFTDLVYKTKLLFQSQHHLRFALIEGQKRTFATVLCLLGYIPPSSLLPHYMLEEKDYEVAQIKHFDRNSVLVYAKEEANMILAKFDVKVVPFYTEVVRDEENLSAKVIHLCQLYSGRLAAQNTKAQHRGWKSVLINILESESLRDACFPFELYSEVMVKPIECTINEWVKNYRHTFLKALFQNKDLQDIWQAFSQETKKLLDSKTRTHEQNAEAMTSGIRYLHEHTINMAQPPTTDRLVYIIMTLVTCAVTTPEEADIMIKVLNGDGQKPGDRLYAETLKVENKDYPATFDLEVRTQMNTLENADRSAGCFRPSHIQSRAEPGSLLICCTPQNAHRSAG